MQYPLVRDEFYLTGLEEGPSDLDELMAEVAAKPEDGTLRFVLGNYLLRSEECSDAVEIYRQAVLLRPSDYKLRCNYGLALACLGRYADAAAVFEKCIEGEPDLELPSLHLGRLLALQNQPERALAVLERLLESSIPDSLPRRRAIFETAKILFECSDHGRTAALLEAVLSEEPQHSGARQLYVKIVFQRGREPYLKGQLEEALSIWGEGAARYNLSFATDEAVQNEFSSFVRRFNEEKEIVDALKVFRAAYREGRRGVPVFYPLVVRYAFSIGLFPEGYESRLQLDRSERRWLDSLERDGEHPYPHFRLGMIHAYRGEIEAAFSELMLFRDRLPPKRHQVFRLKDLIQVITRIKELTTELDSRTGVTATEEDWERWGFADGFERRSWQRTGIMPDEAASWRTRNFSAKQALQWRRYDVALEEAAIWREGGFETARAANRWLRAKIPPKTAKLWSLQFEGEAERAIQAIKAGFEDPLGARDWLHFFLFPFEARPWVEAGFEAAEASAWVHAGFNDPYYAKRWRNSGLAPMDARLEIQAGRSEPPLPNKTGSSE